MPDESYNPLASPEGEPETWSLTDKPIGPINDDLPCRHCGYNLRGMTEGRACPECGTAVGRSLLGDQLRYSDPVWVRTLARGMAWVLYGILLSLLMAIGMIIAQIIFRLDTSALSVIAVIPGLISLIGYWLITTPEPSVNVMSGMTVRSLVRWAMASSIGINLIETMVRSIYPDPGPVAPLVAGILGVVGNLALYVYARRLALRVPDYRLAQQTRVVMWGGVTSLGAVILFGLFTYTFIGGAASGRPGQGGSGNMLLFMISIFVAGTAYCVFAVWSLVLVLWYRRVALSAAVAAEAAWASGI